MARSVYVASVEGHTAKSILALGMVQALRGSNLSVGVFRSVTPNAENDHVLKLLLSQLPDGISYEDSIGVSYKEVHESPERALAKIVSRFRTQAKKFDPMMYQGKAQNLVAKTVLQVSDHVWSQVANWKVPTLIFHGNKDTSTSHLQSQALHEKIASPDRKLLIYPGGFHELLNDLNHQEVERDVLAWLLARV